MFGLLSWLKLYSKCEILLRLWKYIATNVRFVLRYLTLQLHETFSNKITILIAWDRLWKSWIPLHDEQREYSRFSIILVLGRTLHLLIVVRFVLEQQNVLYTSTVITLVPFIPAKPFWNQNEALGDFGFFFYPFSPDLLQLFKNWGQENRFLRSAEPPFSFSISRNEPTMHYQNLVTKYQFPTLSTFYPPIVIGSSFNQNVVSYYSISSYTNHVKVFMNCG